MFTIGNIVTTERDETGIVLAVRKDGTKAKVYRYGKDFESWLPVKWLTTETAGLETCYKCGGSGLYYFGGPVVNGVYQGKTGECYGCGGKGQQNDDDRRRCHYYWHRKVEAGDEIESPLERSPEPEAKPEPARKVNLKAVQNRVRERKQRQPERQDEAALIDCPGCGCLHREDTLCPW